ncbi:MAG: cobalamin biosynthesis protein [Mariprofundales bacterium]|nr:cobalamin biosynthesis protein [Mariprofundales bacterium]
MTRGVNEKNPIVLGLGCDRGTPEETINIAIVQALAAAHCGLQDVVAAASIDKKSDETGLLAVCEHHCWPIVFYSAAQLAKVEVPNPSATVMKYVGTPSVSEAAAILYARGSMTDLIVEKQKQQGSDGKNATVSICRIKE